MAPASRDTSRLSFEKDVAETVEIANPEDLYLERYPLLRDKSKEDLAKLNKSVLRKLDWKFLPCITMMLLMKYAIHNLDSP